MSKRNFILLIIVLAVLATAVSLFLYFRGSPAPGTATDSGGTNFFSYFNPFRSNVTPGGGQAPGTDQGEAPGNTGTEAPSIVKLTKVSSMPVAGFAVFMKERLKDMPIAIPGADPGAPYNFGSATLKNGSTGEAVKEVQRFLNNTRSLSLELDGVLDAEITAAIKEWQSDNGLAADGVIGPKTKAIMYSSVNQETKTTKPTPPPTEFAPALRYVERATGNIYQTFADKIEERKFSSTVIPKIYEAHFGLGGNSVILRRLKADDHTIETFVGNLPKEKLGEDTATNEVRGSFLPDNITDMSVSPDTSKLFYLLNVGNSAVGTTFNLADAKKTQIFDSAFTEWLSSWAGGKTITLTTKPSGIVPGYMYMIDTDKKSLASVLGGINGLTALMSPNGKTVLYADSSLSLSLYRMDTKTSTLLGVRTLPEKCVWSQISGSVYCAVPVSIEGGAVYPDDWYKGEVSFSDQIWKISADDGKTTLIADPIAMAGGEDTDAIKLAVDTSENYLFFVNKKDSFLWKLGLR